MNDMVEAAGGLATGTLIAKQFDHGEAVRDPAMDHGECLNCGTRTSGNFCAECGQATHLHRSMGHVLEEFLHGIWHFDGRAWRTLPKLLLNPGGLTRDYVHGRRARYIAPLALFLLTIFIMFFVFGLSGSGQPAALGINSSINGTPVDNVRLQTSASVDRVLADIDRRIAAAASDPAQVDDVAAMRITRSALKARRDMLAARETGRAEDAVEVEAPWAVAIREAVRSGELRISLPSAELTARVRHALLNPEFTAYKLLQKGYKLSFLLVPMSLPWMLLLFAWKRGVRAYDHVVFLLYSQSFMAMLIIALVLLGRIGAALEWIFAAAVLLPPIHLFLQLKGAYALSGFSAVWRTAALGFFAVVTLSLYFTLILAIGLLE